MKEIKDLKIKDIKTLRGLNIKDIRNEMIQAEKKLYFLKMKNNLNELKQTHLVKFQRRYVSRLKTISNNLV